ncbi:MAG: YraN family protein [Glaciecola sp.]
MQTSSTKKDIARQAGMDAELLAKHHLMDNGLCFVEQNYSVVMGELDLIFRDQEQWVFVEVKYRSNTEYGTAAEYFTANKRQKMHKAIMCYLNDKNLNIHHTSLRIDVVAIDNTAIEWLINV